MRPDGALGESADTPKLGELVECTFVLSLEGVHSLKRWTDPMQTHLSAPRPCGILSCEMAREPLRIDDTPAGKTRPVANISQFKEDRHLF
jgi:hypothetical protein